MKSPTRFADELLAANLKAVADDNEVVVKTSRYLRLSMVGLVVGLGAALAFEMRRLQNKNGEICILDSISAYYHTPAHAVFVGSLVAIGICLIALKGNTDFEDLLLNLAGMFAPFVALVPIKDARTDCGVVTEDFTDRGLNIANNVGALIVVGFAGLALVAGLSLKNLLGSDKSKRPGTLALIGYSVALVFFIAVLISFSRHRDWFTDVAHMVAAIAMFTVIGLNVLVNGYNLYQTRKHPAAGSPQLKPARIFNRYVIIGGLMIVAAVVIALLRPRWHQWLFGLEAAEIGLFAVFWVLQTIELWNQGLRPKIAQATLPPAPADAVSGPERGALA